MWMQTFPKFHRVVTCVTKRWSEVEVSLLDDLCKHMKMSMEKSQIRNIDNVSKVQEALSC